METLEPESINPDLLGDDEGAEPTQVVPPVVAVVVTNDPGPWLEDTLAALGEQDYPALSVLVLDNGSAEDPTPRIAAAMPRAFVRRRPAEPGVDLGFAAAANDAGAAIEGATFLCVMHDDVVLDADAIRLMVEEAYRSNAGIVGPKVVDQAHPEVLLEVGMAVDHYGVPFSGIEPNEVDQEQHDGVRDVFFVSHAAMLVRADLFHELGGFDAATFPGSDDVDLCWRARLAGARVIVAPAARVRHRRATIGEEREPSREVHAETRGRVRLLFKSYSALALVWVLPVSFILEIGEALGSIFTGRVRRGVALLGGWLSAFAHLGELMNARRSTQHLRTVDDGDVRDLMIRGSARMRIFFAQRVHAAERLTEVSERTRSRMEEAGERFRRAPAIIGTILGVFVLFGVRSLLFGRVPAVSGFQAWPGIGAAWSTLSSSWRTTFMGSGAAAAPVFALIGAADTALLGHAGLGRSLLVGGALPLGTWGAYRLVRPLAMSALPGVAAAVAYAANPIVRNAVHQGEIGPLVCYALAPFVLIAFVRMSDEKRAPSLLHATLTVGVLVAIGAAFWPPAIALALLFALSFLIAAPFTGDRGVASRSGVVALGATGVALVLCTPWVWSLIGADRATLGFTPRPPLSLASVVHFDTGTMGSGIAAWGIVVAALVPLFIADGPRLAWATRAWVVAVVSYACTWLPSRISSGAAVPAPDGLLVAAALALAFAAGLGVAAVLDDLRHAHFGWRQPLMFVATIGLALAFVGFSVDTISGRFGLNSNDWAAEYSWMHDNPEPGNFRVLWIGDANILPAGPKLAGDTGYATTVNGPGDARALWAAPAGEADDVLARAIGAVERGSTSRLGHLVAPAGVRYIAFVNRAGPGNGAHGVPNPRLADALGRQLDLSLSRVTSSGVVYENDAWLPMHALVPAGDNTVAYTANDPLVGALRSESTGVQGVDVSHGTTTAVGPGTLLWSEAANKNWHASANGSTLTRRDAFGWTNAFAVPSTAKVSVHYHGALPWLRTLFVLVVWIAAVALWVVTRRRRGAGQ